MTRVEMAAAYQAGATTQHLAAQTGLSVSTILRRLRGAGVMMRPSGGRPGFPKRAAAVLEKSA